MAHARTQIRAAVMAALAVTGYSVTPGRVYPQDVDDAPALSVFTNAEETQQSEDEAMGEPAQARQLALSVEARAMSPSDNLDDALDAVCLEVERAMVVDPTLAGLVEWLTIRTTEYERTADAEMPAGVATLTYDVEYRVDRHDPEIILP